MRNFIKQIRRIMGCVALVSWAGLIQGNIAQGAITQNNNKEALASDRYDIDLSILDRKTKPCDDFYQYACGGWLEKTEIPTDRPAWSRSFSTIDLNNQKILDKILKGYAAGKTQPENPYSKLLGDFYSSCMDEKAIEEHALPEFEEVLKDVDKISDVNALAPLLVKFHREGVGLFFDFGQEQDAKDATQVIGVADQGGLGLPDRDYYLKDDAKMAEIRKLYQEHIAKMFHLLGEKEGAALADKIMKIETALAKASLSKVDRRDPNRVYHRLERKGLIELTPAFDWGVYFENLDKNTTPKLQKINVAVPEFFSELNKVLKTTSLDDLKIYIKWHLMSAYLQALPKRFVDENFRFVSTALSGQKKIEPRWKRCVRAANSKLGFALGRSFVKEAYGEEGKEKSQKMITEIEGTLQGTLETLSWMDDKTRKEALKKLSRINNKVGYPRKWRSYDGLKLEGKSYLKHLQAAEDFNSIYELDKIGKPVDPDEWFMTPPTVNAYYDPQRNEMVFPAGILQYPFFNRSSPNTLNYGAMGVVMGHELTHGFDDQGRRYDADGNLRNWWDPKVLEKFGEKTACVVKEYDQFEILPGLFVNGKLTLGENIADQGGLKVAHQAWKSLHSAAAEPSGSLTPEQKFFISFAQSWCQKEQEPYTRMRATVDPHSPSRYRVNGTVSQFEPFAKAFGCQAGSKMAPVNHCEVW